MQKTLEWTVDRCTNRGDVDIDWEEDVTVEIDFVGRHYRATRLEPAEYPEPQIVSAWHSDGTECFLTTKEENAIIQYCYDHQDEWEREEEECRREMAAEMRAEENW